MTKTHHHFFVLPSAIKEEAIVIRDRDQIHQISRVLRLREGDKVIVLDGSGMEYEVKIMEISRDDVRCRLIERRESRSEPGILIRLFQALPKQPSKFEELLRHGTEVGVGEFYPLITQNTEAQELRKRERMEHILKESAEQSERGKIPIIGPEVKLSEVLKEGWPPDLMAEVTLFAHSREDGTVLPEVLRQMGTPKSINIVIGPEGGFTDEEVSRAHKRAFIVFGLGPRILRTETAGVAVVSALLLGSFSTYH